MRVEKECNELVETWELFFSSSWIANASPAIACSPSFFSATDDQFSVFIRRTHSFLLLFPSLPSTFNSAGLPLRPSSHRDPDLDHFRKTDLLGMQLMSLMRMGCWRRSSDEEEEHKREGSPVPAKPSPLL